MIPTIALGVAMAATTPCFVPLQSTEAPQVFAPRSGIMPPNGRVVVIDPASTFRLLEVDPRPGAGGELREVDVDVSSINVNDGDTTPFELRVLTPKDLVLSELIVERDGEAFGEVNVEPNIDLEPPPRPTATLIGPYTDGACPPYVELDVEPADDVAFVIATVEGDDDVIDGISVDRQLIVAGPADETRDVTLRSVDLVGHLSEPVSIEMTFPPEIELPGCSCSGSSIVDVSAASLLLLALRRRRR